MIKINYTFIINENRNKIKFKLINKIQDKIKNYNIIKKLLKSNK